MKRKIALSILFALLLVSCTAAQPVTPAQPIDLEDMEVIPAMTYLAEDIDIGDGGLLSGQPCASPCAFAVHIGETQLEQVIPILEDNGISRCWTEPNLTWSLVSCGGNRLNVQVARDTNLVVAIWFDPSLPVSLRDLTEKYGAPGYVTVDQNAPDRIVLRVYWNAIRMSVTLPEISGDSYDVERKTEMEAVQFSDETVYRAADQASNPYYQPWHGYGPYRPTEPFPVNPKPVATATP